MSDLHHILRRAARRELAQRMLRRSGLGLIAGLALGCFLLGADRLGLLAVSGLTYVLVAALGAIAGAATAMLAGPDRLALAVRLDRAYRLDDRLATAESLQRGSGRGQDAAFAALVGREADRLAGTLDVRPALPVRIPRLWGGAAALATLLAIGALFLPAVDPARRADAAEIRQREEAQREERASVADSIRDVVEDLEAEAALDETTKEELDALDALAGQLSGENAEDFDPAAARDESAARINELADRLAEQAEKDAAAVEELTERFAGLDSPEAPMSAEEFSEALRRGEFGRAADLLDEMMRNRDAMTEEERQAVADHLRTLGQNIEDTARSEDPGLDQRRDGLEDALRDQGLTEDEIDRLLDPQEPRTEDVQRDLESRNVDEEVSRELAEDIDELRRQRQTEEQANREAQNVADAVRRAAESMETDRRRETPPAGEGAAKPPQPQPDDRPPAGAGEPPQGREEQPPTGATPPQSGPNDETGEQRPGTETPPESTGPDTQSPPAGQPPSAKQPPTGAPTEQPGSQSTEQDPAAQPPQPGQERPAGSETAEPGGGERAPGRQPAGRRGDEPTGDERSGPEAGGTGQRDGREAGAAPPPGPDRQGRGPSSPADIVRELERRRQMAERRQEAADRAREVAGEMAENMTEEERRRWAEQWQREFGLDDESSTPTLQDDAALPEPFETDELDLTDDELSRRTIAEWLSDRRTDPASGATETGPPAPHVRRAQQTAERAVEDAAVPARYHRLIRQYFGRLEETVDKAASAPAQAPPSNAKPAQTSAAESTPTKSDSDPPPQGDGES